MSKRRILAPDEIDLWTSVKKTVTPLHSPLRPLIVEGELSQEAGKSATKPPEPLPNSAKASALPPYRPDVSMLRHKGGKPDLDRPTHRNLAKGRLTIDARIDLHDMTQAVAHHRLASFIANAHATGQRHVLVITGKGRSSDGGTGVLRRLVPMWLSTEPMKNHVGGYSWSARHHGGEGALYVRLKRKR